MSLFHAIQIVRTRLARGPCGYSVLSTEVSHQTGASKEHLRDMVLDALDTLILSGEISRVDATSHGEQTIYRLGKG